MSRQALFNLIEVLDKEIKAYSNLKQLFEEKKETLIHSKADDLGELDNKILSLNDKIKRINDSRRKIVLEIVGDEEANMSTLIAFAEEGFPDFAEKLKERKVKICKLFSDLALLNNQNVELLKHGIIISNKMLETIINAFAPQGSFYNGAGKTDTHEMDMWTINEEI